jgi:hypothetical protein
MHAQCISASAVLRGRRLLLAEGRASGNFMPGSGRYDFPRNFQIRWPMLFRKASCALRITTENRHALERRMNRRSFTGPLTDRRTRATGGGCRECRGGSAQKGDRWIGSRRRGQAKGMAAGRARALIWLTPATRTTRGRWWIFRRNNCRTHRVNVIGQSIQVSAMFAFFTHALACEMQTMQRGALAGKELGNEDAPLGGRT